MKNLRTVDRRFRWHGTKDVEDTRMKCPLHDKLEESEIDHDTKDADGLHHVFFKCGHGFVNYPKADPPGAYRQCPESFSSWIEGTKRYDLEVGAILENSK